MSAEPPAAPTDYAVSLEATPTTAPVVDGELDPIPASAAELEAAEASTYEDDDEEDDSDEDDGLAAAPGQVIDTALNVIVLGELVEDGAKLLDHSTEDPAPLHHGGDHS